MDLRLAGRREIANSRQIIHRSALLSGICVYDRKTPLLSPLTVYLYYNFAAKPLLMASMRYTNDVNKLLETGNLEFTSPTVCAWLMLTESVYD